MKALAYIASAVRGHKALSIAAIFMLLLFGTWVSAGPSQYAEQPLADMPPADVPSPRPSPAMSGASDASPAYPVSKVVDGDTFDVLIDGKTERIRMIGVDTPETVDPRKPVQCFGREASARTSELLVGKRVRLEADPTQDERDKYGRLLRYVRLEDGRDFGLIMIWDGYAHEYTYAVPHERQAAYAAAERQAEASGAGLWGAACSGEAASKPAASPAAPPADIPAERPSSCAIKGNISSSGEKIYHVPGCASYVQTKIDEQKGERWFCSEAEASSAGWRKAMNCS